MKKGYAALLLLSAAAMMASCSSGDSSQSGGSAGSSAPLSTPSVDPNAGLGTAGATPTPSPSPTPTTWTSRAGCGIQPLRNYFQSQVLQGTAFTSGSSVSSGSVFYYGDGQQITADQTLRVSVTPGNANTSVNSAGSNPYTQMAMKVTMHRSDGQTQSLSMPQQVYTSGSPYRNAIAVGSESDPMLLDFSTLTRGAPPNSYYYLEVSNVMTDYKCNAFCTLSQYCYNQNDPYCTYSGGWQWVYDYHSQQQVMCCGTNLDTCQRNFCGVGGLVSGSTWTVTVKVESDLTTCIQP